MQRHARNFANRKQKYDDFAYPAVRYSLSEYAYVVFSGHGGKNDWRQMNSL